MKLLRLTAIAAMVLIQAGNLKSSAASSPTLGSLARHTAMKATRLAQVRWIDHGLLVQPPHRKRMKGKKKMPLYKSYALHTGTQQRASIAFRDGTVLHLNQRTDAILRSPHITAVRAGEVDEVLAPGTDHRIQTATALAAAIGTNFDVRVERRTSRFVVVSGVLRVQNKYGTVEVQRNQLTDVAPNKKPTKPVPIQAQQVIGWTKDMPKTDLGENIALSSNGGTVVGVSSESTPGAAKKINDGLLETAWTTAKGKVADQWVKIGFNGAPLYALTAVIIDPAAGSGTSSGEDLKDFEIRISPTDASEGSFYTVLKGTAAQKKTLQRFELPTVHAKYIELYVHSNYGSPNGVGVAELEVVGSGVYLAKDLLNAPQGLTTDAQGDIFVADMFHARILKFSPRLTLLARIGGPGAGPGQFANPTDVKVDAQGDIYVMDSENYRVQKFSPTGKPLLQWGTRGSGPGQFDGPRSTHLGIDSQANIYVADSFNKRIQKFSPSGALLAVFTVPGSDPGNVATPEDVAPDARGNLWVTDQFNIFGTNVHELSPSGQLVTGFTNLPSGPGTMALDKQGNVYVGFGVADPPFTTGMLEKFSPDGRLLAKWGGNGNVPGQVGGPAGLAVDVQGNVYEADGMAGRITKFSPTGEVLAIWY